MTTLYPYQEQAVIEIKKHFETKEKVLLQLPTGAGKTVVFSFFIKDWLKNNPNKKVLVLVHRDELLKQSLKSLRSIGVTCESVVSTKNRLQHNSQVYVAMVETVANRLNKDMNYLLDVGLLIADECHLLLFQKVYNYFKKAKILGCSATPISYKKISFAKCGFCGNTSDTIDICCGFEMYEYTRKFTFSEIYEEIVSTVQVSELINLGNLTKELNYKFKGVNRNSFKIDNKTGDFDSKSMDKEYSKSGAIADVLINYEKLCKGKKTLIFNPSIKMNELVYQRFIEEGYAKDQIKILDSKNKEGGRKFILDWFKNTDGAILINAGILVAGFDEETIEAIIMNRSTISFALYLQIIGRGGRITKQFFKANFIHIDLGGNIDYFKRINGENGYWSDDVDWKSIFYGTNEKPKAKKEPLEQVKECSGCGALISRATLSCEYCGEIEPQKKKRELSVSDEVATLIDEIPLPDGIKIVQYCERIGADKNFAWLILQNQIIELFIRHGVTFGTYQKTQDNGKFEISIRKIIKQPYQIIQGSFLDGGTMRTKAWIIGRIKNKLDKYYSK